MPMEQALPGRLARWIAVAEPDRDRVYREPLPRVYNVFRIDSGLTDISRI